MTVASLEAARNKARAQAAHPRVLELRAILASNASAQEKRAAQTELMALRNERQALQGKHASTVAEAQGALSAGRRAARDAARAEATAKFRDWPTDELVRRRHELTAERKKLKLELEPIVSVLGERQAEERVSELLSTMNDADKRALLQQLQTRGVESKEAVGIPGRG